MLFRADSLSGALGYLGAMIGLGAEGVRHPAAQHLNLWIGLVFLAGLVGSAPWLPRLRDRLQDRPVAAWAGVALVLALLLLSVIELAAGTANPFIYFRF